jgi:hypothetical protein
VNFPPLLWLVAIAIAMPIVAWFFTRHQRDKLLTRLRSAWGRIAPISGLDDDRVTEGWRELRPSPADDDELDARTWADLDLDRILATLDRTHTGLGRQRLYWRLRSGAPWQATPALEPLVEEFGSNATLRETVGSQLSGAGSHLGYGLWVLTRPELIVVRWWYWAFPLLAIAMLGSLIAIPFVPKFVLLAMALVVINLIVRMATAWQMPGLLAPMRQIGPLIGSAERLLEIAELRDLGKGRIATDVADLRPLKRISRWVSRDPVASGEILTSIWEYFNILFILDANALFLGARHLRRLGPVLARVASWVGDVDVTLMVASLRAEPRDWCVPTSRPGPTVVSGMWHPLIDEPVTNDVTLVPGHGAIITGANMSGKSTYLRTVGIAAVLARALKSCPAAAWQGEVFRVRSLIGRNDDLAAGKSYYQVEADGVVSMLHDAASPHPTLFLLDELLRGTNTIERLAAGEAVLRALLAAHPDGSPHVVIVATHDGELVSMLADGYAPFHFRETIGPDGLSFDYHRHGGPASTRTAIALLEATGAPAAVVAAARARAEALDRGAHR